MKIIAIDSKRTVSRYKVAFILDRAISPEVLKAIKLEPFHFTADGQSLIMTAPTDGSYINEFDLTNLHNAILKAQKDVTTEAAERQRMLEGISRAFNLPLSTQKQS